MSTGVSFNANRFASDQLIGTESPFIYLYTFLIELSVNN